MQKHNRSSPGAIKFGEKYNGSTARLGARALVRAEFALGSELEFASRSIVSSSSSLRSRVSASAIPL